MGTLVRPGLGHGNISTADTALNSNPDITTEHEHEEPCGGGPVRGGRAVRRRSCGQSRQLPPVPEYDLLDTRELRGPRQLPGDAPAEEEDCSRLDTGSAGGSDAKWHTMSLWVAISSSHSHHCRFFFCWSHRLQKLIKLLRQFKLMLLALILED